MKIKPASVKILTACYVIILAVIIFVADRKSTAYLLNFIGNIPYGDKIGHFVLMGTLSFWVNLLLNLRTIGFGKIRYLLGSVIVLGLVTIEEFSQLFIKGRTFDKTDLAADFIGILIFGELARLAYNRFFDREEV
jgi:uncharacterized protein YhhL (DUF1145 family)